MTRFFPATQTMISTVDRQDMDLTFHSRGLNYALETILSSFLWDIVERRKWTDLRETASAAWQSR